MWYKESNHIKQCQVGDKFYRIMKNRIVPIQIMRVTHHELGHYTYEDDLNYTHRGSAFGSSLFRTKEECEEELRRRQNIREKRKLMKEYETELNRKFGLEDHFIIK